MLGEESPRSKAEVHLAALLDLLLFWYLPGRAEAEEKEDVEQVYLWDRKLLQGAAPVYRSPLLSASDGSAFAAAPVALPGSGQCLTGS